MSKKFLIQKFKEAGLETLEEKHRRALSERGAAMVEYALLLSLIAVVCIGSVQMLGDETDQALTRASNGIASGTVVSN